MSPISRLGALLALVLSLPSLAAAWDVTTYQGRGYVSVDQVAAFYGFESGGDGKAFVLERPGIELRGREGSKELRINRLRFHLSFPAVPWGDKTLVSVFDVSHLIEPVLRPPSAEAPRTLKTVVLDPAHGGDESGVRVSGGASEKEITLAVSKALAARLRAAGYEVVLTRESDTTLSTEERANAAAAQAPNGDETLFLSLHLSRSDDPTVAGVESYILAPTGTPATYDPDGTKPDLNYYVGNLHESENTALATALHGTLVAAAGVADRGVRRARFQELKAVQVPAVALRLGFLSHPEEGAALSGPAYQEKLAAALASGVDRYAAYLKRGRSPLEDGETVLGFDGVRTQSPNAENPAMEEEHTLVARIKRTADGAEIDPSQIDIQVYFFDRVGTDIVEPSAAEPPEVAWVSVLPDWKAHDTEELSVTYRRPLASGDEGGPQHRYLGYVVRLLYGGKVQATLADPPQLDRCLPQFYAVTGEE